MGPMPLLPATMFDQVVWTSDPQGLTAPRPVITTLRMRVPKIPPRPVRASRDERRLTRPRPGRADGPPPTATQPTQRASARALRFDDAESRRARGSAESRLLAGRAVP